MKWTSENMPSQAGKTALVTGATSGIGLQAALELARHGAHVLVGARDRSRGEAAVAKIAAAAPGANVELAMVDVASLASVRAFAAAFVARGLPLDLLINNAGVMAIEKRELTEDGFEKQMGTNHLGHFALTGLLMPALLAAHAPRVVSVASLAHRTGKIEMDNLQSEREYSAWGTYNNSKLANILFANELDRRARAVRSKLVSMPVHPGVSKTNIFSSSAAFDLKRLVVGLLGPLVQQDDRMGALPTLYAATAPEAKGGEYIGPDGRGELKGYPTVVEPKPQAKDAATAEKLWAASEKLTGVVYPPLA